MNDAVFLSYDKTALDAEYDNRAKVPDVAAYKDAQAAASDEVRARFAARLDAAYGPGADERLDIFPAAGPPAAPAPVHVFFHGGYWKSNHRQAFSFVARPFVPAGAAVVVVEYGLIPAVDMAELVRQCRAAMDWVWRNAAAFGGDPDRITVSGHSAGGHLVAMMMATDWPAFAADLPADLVKAGCAISGLYDLEPVRLSAQNDALGLDAEEARRFSPVLMQPCGGGKLLLPVGELEGPEFIRQSSDLAHAWRAAGADVQLWVMPGHHHFSIINQFLDPASQLSQAVRGQMGLG